MATYAIGSVLPDTTFEIDRNGHTCSRKAPLITAARRLAKSPTAFFAIEYHVVRLGKNWMDDQTVFIAKVKRR